MAEEEKSNTPTATPETDDQQPKDNKEDNNVLEEAVADQDEELHPQPSLEEKKEIDGVLSDVYQEFNNSFNETKTNTMNITGHGSVPGMDPGVFHSTSNEWKGFGSDDTTSNNNNNDTIDNDNDDGIKPVIPTGEKLTNEQIEDMFIQRLREKKKVQTELQEKNSLKHRTSDFFRGIVRTLSGESSNSRNSWQYKKKYGNIEEQKQRQLDIIKQQLGPELAPDVTMNDPALLIKTGTGTTAATLLASPLSSPSSYTPSSSAGGLKEYGVSSNTNIAQEQVLSETMKEQQTNQRIEMLKRMGIKDVPDAMNNSFSNNSLNIDSSTAAGVGASPTSGIISNNSSHEEPDII